MLRGVLGISLLVQAVLCLGETGQPEIWRGVMALLGGALLTLGLLTPAAAALIALSTGLFAYLRLPCCEPDLFGASFPVILGATLLAGIFLLGPGAFSFDARIFGRREIIIPPSSSLRR